jgi:hypothetical protein
MPASQISHGTWTKLIEDRSNASYKLEKNNEIHSSTRMVAKIIG